MRASADRSAGLRPTGIRVSEKPRLKASFSGAFICAALVFASSLLAPFHTSFAQLKKEKSVDQLVKELTDSDKFIRRDAALQLSEMGPDAREAVPALIEALKDREYQVWYASVMALGRIGPDAEPAVPALIEGLLKKKQRGENSRQMWYRHAYALGQIGPAALPKLAEALESDEAAIRSGAAKALGFMGPAAQPVLASLVQRLGDDDEDVRYQSADALAQFGAPAITHLVDSLGSAQTNATIRLSAVMALAGMGKAAGPAIPALLKLIETETDPKQRARTIDAVSRAGHTGADWVALLVSSLCEELDATRHAAANALLTLPSPETLVVPKLLEVLHAQDFERASRAAVVLGRLGEDGRSAVPPLIHRLRETAGLCAATNSLTQALVEIGSPAVPDLLAMLADIEPAALHTNMWMVQCMIGIGPPAIPEFIEGMTHSSESVRAGVAMVLESMNTRARSAAPNLTLLLADSSPHVRSRAIRAAIAVGVKRDILLDKLRPALNDGSVDVRAAAAAGIGSLGAAGRTALEDLVHVLNEDQVERVRIAVVAALGSMGEQAEAAVTALVKHLPNASGDLRSELIKTLGRVGAPAAVAAPRLVELAKPNVDPLTRQQALESLGKIGTFGPDGEPVVREALKDSDAAVRASALVALSRVESDPATSMPMLLDALDDESPLLRMASAEALGNLGKNAQEAAPKLFSMLDRDNEQDRQAALDALRLIRTESVSHLIAALGNKDSSVRLFACEALGQLGKKAVDALPALQTATKDQYDFVRQQARAAIRRIEE